MYHSHHHFRSYRSRHRNQESGSSSQFSIPVSQTTSALATYFESTALAPTVATEPPYSSPAEYQISPASGYDHEPSLHEQTPRRTHTQYSGSSSRSSTTWTSNDYTQERDASRFYYRRDRSPPRVSFDYGEEYRDHFAGSPSPSPDPTHYEYRNGSMASMNGGIPGGSPVIHYGRESTSRIPRHVGYPDEYAHESPRSSRPSIETDVYGRNSGSTLVVVDCNSSPPTTFPTPEMMAYGTSTLGYGNTRDGEHLRQREEARYYDAVPEDESRHRSRHHAGHRKPAKSRSRSSIREFAEEILHVGRRRYHR